MQVPGGLFGKSGLKEALGENLILFRLDNVGAKQHWDVSMR